MRLLGGDGLDGPARGLKQQLQVIYKKCFEGARGIIKLASRLQVSALRHAASSGRVHVRRCP